MKKKIIVRIAEGIGNQLFIYAHAFALSKIIGCDLLIDNTSAYYNKKINLDRLSLINSTSTFFFLIKNIVLIRYLQI